MTADYDRPDRKITRSSAPGAPQGTKMLLGAGPYSVAAVRTWYDSETGTLKHQPISWEEFHRAD